MEINGYEILINCIWILFVVVIMYAFKKYESKLRYFLLNLIR
jgi:hypothetical protein